MLEQQLFEPEEQTACAEIADALHEAANRIETRSVELCSREAKQTGSLLEMSRFEVELKRLTDSETGEQRYELEYELRWTE